MLALLRHYRHRLAHRLHWQTGHIISEWWGDELWIGFRCATCGEVSGAFVADRRAGALNPTPRR